ncbi:MAG: phosphoribosyltransferase [Thermodesulfobacteriota bacterium]
MWGKGDRYKDRDEAGRVLASMLGAYMGGEGLVLAIPNGGVAVGAAISRALRLGLGLMVVRKIQFPHNPEAGFGAVGADGTVVLDEGLMTAQGLGPEDVRLQKEKALRSVRERVERFGARALLPPVKGRKVILVDDGLATGSTMEAAVSIARRQGPAMVTVAVPTASHRAWGRIKGLVDDLVCPRVGRGPFFAVADAYQCWCDVTDDEVIQIMYSMIQTPPSGVPS